MRGSVLGSNHATVGRIFLNLAPYLRTRLYGSAKALEPMFRSFLSGSTDVVVLFTKGTVGSKSPVEVNPRQSFRWNGVTSSIESFEDFAHVAETLKIDVLESNPKTVETIYREVDKAAGPYVPLIALSLDRTVHLFISAGTLSAEDEVFLEVLQPYLEMFRTSTIHALNDLYRTRDDDLVAIVGDMTPSTAGMIQALLQHVGKHARFGRPDPSAWEFDGNTWNLRMRVESESTAEIFRVLSEDANKKLLGLGQALAVDLRTSHALVVPFMHLRDELMFNSDGMQGNKALLKPIAKARSIHSGDWAIVLAFNEPPHANIVHALIHYRQVYFDTYRPQLLRHIHHTIYERATQIQTQYLIGNWKGGAPDLWTALRKLCDEVLPTIFQALEVSGGVSVYNAADYVLDTIFSWDEPGAKRLPNANRTRLSLQRGHRGIAATTFLDTDSDHFYCKDVSRTQPRGAPKPVYLKVRESTRSEYCIKLKFKNTPIGIINFESPHLNGFSDATQREISVVVRALEHYIREFLDAQDSHWLAITASAYHNLHELRQQAEHGKWGTKADQDRLLAAIAAFDDAIDEGFGDLAELEDHFHECLDSQLKHAFPSQRTQLQTEAEARTKFSLNRRNRHSPVEVHRLRLELLKRITTNLMSNFDIAGKSDRFDSFKVSYAARPYQCIRFAQEQQGGFPSEWVTNVGFAPLRGGTDADHTHHGLFLCGAIARSLGGFLWAGNRQVEGIGVQSVVEVVVPLDEATE